MSARGPRRWRAAGSAVTAAAMVTLGAVAGCSGDDPADPAPPRESGTTHGDVEEGSAGVLSVSVGGGGSALERPPDTVGRLRGTFGAFMLCSRSAGVVPEIDAITFPDGSPAGTVAWVRTVTPAAVAAVDERDRANFVPLAFGLGAPPDFREPYAAELEVLGDYRRGVAGVKVEQSCTESADATTRLNRYEVPATPLLELMIVVPAGPAGAVVDGFTLDYHQGSSSYRLPVEWQMTVCDRARRLPNCT